MPAPSTEIQSGNPLLPTAAIIGHGESPKGQGWGPLIDATQGPVIRMKDPTWQLPADYGKRLDYLSASSSTLLVMLSCKRIPQEYWVMPKGPVRNKHLEGSFQQQAKAPLRVFHDLYVPYLEAVRARFSHYQDNRVTASLGVSTILFALDFLGVKHLRLVGFDNLLDPKRDFYRKANNGVWHTKHLWEVEHTLFLEMLERYGATYEGGF